MEVSLRSEDWPSCKLSWKSLLVTCTGESILEALMLFVSDLSTVLSSCSRLLKDSQQHTDSINVRDSYSVQV